jgi:ribosome-binding protein aMBF1 (putative translation factor)
MNRGEQIDAGRPPGSALRDSDFSTSHATSFGEAVHKRRIELGLSQSAVSSAASVAAGYLSEIESGKRLAPRRAAALRIARALGFGSCEEQRLLALAEVERAASTHDAHLSPGVRKLLAEIRMTAPQMRPEAVECLRVLVREISM